MQASGVAKKVCHGGRAPVAATKLWPEVSHRGEQHPPVLPKQLGVGVAAQPRADGGVVCDPAHRAQQGQRSNARGHPHESEAGALLDWSHVHRGEGSRHQVAHGAPTLHHHELPAHNAPVPAEAGEHLLQLRLHRSALRCAVLLGPLSEPITSLLKGHGLLEGCLDECLASVIREDPQDGYARCVHGRAEAFDQLHHSRIAGEALWEALHLHRWPVAPVDLGAFLLGVALLLRLNLCLQLLHVCIKLHAHLLPGLGGLQDPSGFFQEL
mmetsp:Transcript_34503/g.80125  ORF Transcript_34503/g.80125 Transcript_34503/m.80125 type:complete len:268 (+) Transcript_34503:437-1240(+)